MQIAPHLRPSRALLQLLTTPQAAAGLHEPEWDNLIRVARSSRLLATLYHRLLRAEVLDQVPAAVRRHLDSDFMLARFRQHAARHQLTDLERALAPLGVPLIVLKGAAYVLQGLACSAGRFLSDVDLMVPRQALPVAEAALKDADWEFGDLDPYDEHYYRAWVHELPPMRCPGHYLELDLHHTILPLTGRAQPDASALFRDARALPGTAFRVLCPADQVLHACAHLAQDSDFTDRLRDLVDVDALVREFDSTAGFWTALIERARMHGLGRALWYCLRYCQRWLATPIPDDVASRLEAFRPALPVQWAMDQLVSRALLPPDPDEGRSIAGRLASNLLLLRSHWLRMPLPLLIRHTWIKTVRRYRTALPQPRGAA
jgi:hypothetical protein